MALTDMPGHLIRRLNQISTTIFQQGVQEAGFDLTPVQFSAMQVLRDKTDIEQAQIAALIAYDRATIGGVIDRLEKKGYVSRVVSKQDRRARLCRLTDQGREIIGKVIPIVEALQSEILNGLSQDEREQFIALAQKAVFDNQDRAC